MGKCDVFKDSQVYGWVRASVGESERDRARRQAGSLVWEPQTVRERLVSY